jgi:hypothetical protein
MSLIFFTGLPKLHGDGDPRRACEATVFPEYQNVSLALSAFSARVVKELLGCQIAVLQIIGGVMAAFNVVATRPFIETHLPLSYTAVDVAGGWN